MSLIRRVYVEKKHGFDISAKGLLSDLVDNLSINSLENVRIINCYDVEGLTAQDYKACISTVFSEPPVDIVHEEEFKFDKNDFIFSIMYLPGQYNQRADSAMQCIQIVTGTETAIVETKTVYVCTGELTYTDKLKIKNYCINPVDSMETSLEKPESLVLKTSVPLDVEIISINELSDFELNNLYNSLGLAMNIDDFFFMRNYFRNEEKREPTITEIRMIDTYWSDHCRHTTFQTELTEITFEEGQYKSLFEESYKLYLEEREIVYRNKQQKKPVTLMDLAVMGMKVLKNKGFLNDLDESEEINACSIVVDVDVNDNIEPWLIMFKNETHNHPTEIEPFGGAATCLGGAIRDPLSGRSYVYQAMRVTGSGDPRTAISDTIAGKLPQRRISQDAARGYSSYGNEIGIATGQVTEIYNEGYVAKRMEIGAVIGAVKKDSVVRERPAPSDAIILLGGRTGRDGCGGATGSSKQHDEQSILECGAEVQKGNPVTERKLQRLFANPKVSKMIKRCNDFGAGGVSVAIGELADGLIINLDKIPKKYEGLDGTELAISESQERMACVISSTDIEEFIGYALEENLEATHVADVTEERRLKMTWRNAIIVDITRDFLDTNGANQYAAAHIINPENFEDFHWKNIVNIERSDIANFVTALMGDLSVASQKGLSERFDNTIGAGTVLLPYGGKKMLTKAEVMAAKVPVPFMATNTATLMAFGYNPIFSKWSPFHGAVYAVIESVSKIVCAGGAYEKIRLTFQEYFERLGGNKERWGKPLASLLGAFYAQMKLNIPSIGGKDSMSGSFMDLDVPPTLVSFAVDTASTNEIISPEFKERSSISSIVLVKTKYDDNSIPDFEQLIANYEFIHKFILDKIIISAHTVSEGGIIATINKMALGNGISFDVNLDLSKYNTAPQYGSFILEVPYSNEETADIFYKTGIDFEILGHLFCKSDTHLTMQETATFNEITIPLSKIENAWLKPLESVFPTGFFKKVNREDITLKPFLSTKTLKSRNAFAKPKVFIPVFPGTNCENDMANKFESAGAEAEIFVIKNLNIAMLEESIKKMEEAIDSSQMIAIPGGFSAGDEPEGSGKFIAAVFRNPYIKEATMNLLRKREGLILGICNGFQALVKLGLIPFGEIEDMDENSPTLTFNEIGRHISVLSHTKVVSNVSPWLYNTEVGDTHIIPISHGEGRFTIDRQLLDELAKNGQVATQYVDFNGNATMDIRHNPNGSFFAVEGVTSPDGRIFGKMGHSERVGQNLYKNVTGNDDQKLFESGVNYFK